MAGGQRDQTGEVDAPGVFTGVVKICHVTGYQYQ